MPWYAILLAPFALMFRMITGIRNFLFDKGIFESLRSPIPTLVVGNLSVGGTGKTPMVEFLVRNLSKQYQVAILSRGYGRKTTGFLKAQPNSRPEEIGDEPLQLYHQFQGRIPVFVGEDRVASLHKIQETHPQLDLVILDDAFQHRTLQADTYFLLTPYHKPFFQDYLLPMGRLRESRMGAKRAHAVVVTKCPEDLQEAKREKLMKGLTSYIQSGTPVVFSKLNYGVPYLIGQSKKFSGQVVLVSGLADDRLFKEYCAAHFQVLESFSFPDHHAYTEKELGSLINALKQHQAKNPVVLCTEKDAEKLKFLSQSGSLGEFPIFALPITVQFTPQDEAKLFNLIHQKINK